MLGLAIGHLREGGDRVHDRAQHVRLEVVLHVLQHGRQALQAGTFDVLLLDVRLPDGNGLDLASGLPEPRPIMVAMTASVVPSPREAAMKAGCDGFLEKPFQPHDLQGVLTRLLDRLVPA